MPGDPVRQHRIQLRLGYRCRMALEDAVLGYRVVQVKDGEPSSGAVECLDLDMAGVVADDAEPVGGDVGLVAVEQEGRQGITLGLVKPGYVQQVTVRAE